MKTLFLKTKGSYFTLAFLLLQLCISNNAIAQCNNVGLVVSTLNSCECTNKIASIGGQDDDNYTYTYSWSVTNLCSGTSISGGTTDAITFNVQKNSTVSCTVEYSDGGPFQACGTYTMAVPVDNLQITAIAGPTSISCTTTNPSWSTTSSNNGGTPSGQNIVYHWSGQPSNWSTPGNSSTYAPSSTPIPSSGGNFTLQVYATDGICTTPTQSIIVALPTPPSNPVISGATAVCTSGGTTTVTYSVPAVSGATYSWSGTRTSGTGSITLQGPPTSHTNSIQFNGAGVFNVCLTEVVPVGSCSYTLESCITVTTVNAIPATPTFEGSVYEPVNVACPDNVDVITLNADAGAAQYNWTNSNTSAFLLASSVSTAPAMNVTVTNYASTATITVSASNVCGTSGIYSIHLKSLTETQCGGGNGGGGGGATALGTENIDETTNNYRVYPNPVSSQLTVEYPYSNTSSQILSIYDMLGKKVASYELPASQTTTSLNVSTLPVGLFVYSITSGDDVVQRGKITVQR